MSLGINTNIASLSAQRALSGSQADAATAMQRLSTGLRINSAKDDAAGMAVSNAMTAKISGLQVASRNASDAVAMLQTAEGGLSAITDNLLRIRELAVQSASDTLDDTQRGYLNQEVEQLRSEIDRVAQSTKFGSNVLLNGGTAAGSDSTFTFQVGAGNNVSIDRMSVSIGDYNSAQLGTAADVENADSTTSTTSTAGVALASAASGITLAVGSGSAVNIGVTSDNGNDLAGAYATLINNIAGVSATSANAATGAISLSENAAAGATSDSTDLIAVVGGNEVVIATLTGATTYNAAAVDAAMDLSADSDLSKTGDLANGNLVITNASGEDVAFKWKSTSGNAFTAGTITVGSTVVDTANDDTANTADVATGKVTITSTGTVANATLTFAGGERDDLGIAGVGAVAATGGTTTAATKIDAVSVSTQANARNAIAAIDEALDTVNNGRAGLGASQSRLEAVIENADVSAENAMSARSRVLDADFAQESAMLAKTQVLQQAGISVLAQANAMPQQVLALLQ